MTTKHGPESRPAPASTEERGAETLGTPGLIHLAICLAITAAVVIALNLAGWLA